MFFMILTLGVKVGTKEEFKCWNVVKFWLRLQGNEARFYTAIKSIGTVTPVLIYYNMVESFVCFRETFKTLTRHSTRLKYKRQNSPQHFSFIFISILQSLYSKLPAANRNSMYKIQRQKELNYLYIQRLIPLGETFFIIAHSSTVNE